MEVKVYKYIYIYIYIRIDEKKAEVARGHKEQIRQVEAEDNSMNVYFIKASQSKCIYSP